MRRLVGSCCVILVVMLQVVGMGCLLSQGMNVAVIDRVNNLTDENLTMRAKVVNHGSDGWVTVVGYVEKQSGRVEQEQRIHLGRNEEKNVMFIFGVPFSDIDLAKDGGCGFELRGEEPD